MHPRAAKSNLPPRSRRPAAVRSRLSPHRLSSHRRAHRLYRTVGTALGGTALARRPFRPPPSAARTRVASLCIHPFSDPIVAPSRAVSLDRTRRRTSRAAFAANRAPAMSLTSGSSSLMRDSILAVATRGAGVRTAAQKNRHPCAELDPTYAPILERAWDNGLEGDSHSPAFPASPHRNRSHSLQKSDCKDIGTRC